MTPSSEDEEDSFNRFSARDSGPKFDDDEPEFPRYKPAEAAEAIESDINKLFYFQSFFFFLMSKLRKNIKSTFRKQ